MLQNDGRSKFAFMRLNHKAMQDDRTAQLGFRPVRQLTDHHTYLKVACTKGNFVHGSLYYTIYVRGIPLEERER